MTCATDVGVYVDFTTLKNGTSTMMIGACGDLRLLESVHGWCNVLTVCVCILEAKH